MDKKYLIFEKGYDKEDGEEKQKAFSDTVRITDEELVGIFSAYHYRFEIC